MDNLRFNAESKWAARKHNINELKNNNNLKFDKRRAIVTLGDSFTYGAGVQANQTFSYLLSEKISTHQVINAGVAGASIHTMHTAYLCFNNNPQIKLVILTVMDVDVLRPFNFTGGVKSRDDAIDQTNYAEQVEHNLKYLTSIVKDCDKKGINFILTLWPRSPFRLKTNSLNKRLQNYSNQNKIHYIADYGDYLSLYPDFKLVVSRTDWHPSVLGHQLIAKRLNDFIQEKKLIKNDYK